MNHEAVIEKAKALIALRERAATEGEALAAAKALAKLLEKHRLSVAEVEAANSEPEEPFEVFHDLSLIPKFVRLPRWERNLSSCLGAHYGVALWTHSRPKGWDRAFRLQWLRSMKMCGRRSDVEMLRFMFAHLRTEAIRLCPQGRGRRWRNSWLLGFSVGIAAQLKAIRAEAEEENAKAAIVLQGRYDKALSHLRLAIEDIDDAPKLPPMNFDEDAAVSGYIRGRRQHLGSSLPAESAKEPQHPLLPAAKEASD